jgi:hypothetical protein
MEEEVQQIIAEVGEHVWRAKLTLWVIKPLMFLLGVVMYAGGLYGGTWIVVLALRHSGAI